jgi:hypothetical protein
VTVRAYWSVEALSPLHLATSRSLGASTETLPYIPGTALRGALAAAYLAAADAATPSFRLLVEATRFNNLYPAGADAAMASVPLPLSSVTCSHLPGFRADDGHGVGDLLLPAEAALLAAEAATVPDGASDATRPPAIDVDTLLRCRQCPDDRRRLPIPAMIPWRGYCTWHDGTPRLAPVRVAAVVERRAAGGGGPLVRQAVTVRQALPAGQRFSGEVAFPDGDTAELVTRLLERQEHRLWVGAGRSRGLGAIRVASSAVPTGADDPAQRQRALMEALGERCRQGGVSPPDDQQYVTLTLRSAALVPDAFGRWRQTIGADILGRDSGLPADAWQVRQAYVAQQPIEGWNAALGLPKPDAVAIAAGSCWLLRLQGVSSDELAAALQRLEEHGLGERRSEGYGVVGICDPLHWQVQELEGEQQA